MPVFMVERDLKGITMPDLAAAQQAAIALLPVRGRVGRGRQKAERRREDPVFARRRCARPYALSAALRCQNAPTVQKTRKV